MIPIAALMAVVLHGNTSATKAKRNSYRCQYETPIYGTAHMVRLQVEESSQITKRDSCSVKRRDAHIRYNPYETRLPREESPSCSLALSINSRGFCNERQSQFSSSVSLSLSLLDACFVLGYHYNTLVIPYLHYYIWRSQRDFRKVVRYNSLKRGSNHPRVPTGIVCFARVLPSALTGIWKQLRNLGEINSPLQLLHKSKVSR